MFTIKEGKKKSSYPKGIDFGHDYGNFLTLFQDKISPSINQFRNSIIARYTVLFDKSLDDK